VENLPGMSEIRFSEFGVDLLDFAVRGIVLGVFQVVLNAKSG